MEDGIERNGMSYYFFNELIFREKENTKSFDKKNNEKSNETKMNTKDDKIKKKI